MPEDPGIAIGPYGYKGRAAPRGAVDPRRSGPWTSFATPMARSSYRCSRNDGTRPTTPTRDPEAIRPRPTTRRRHRVLHPGEGGYDEALAEWDLQQNPDRAPAVSTASGRQEAMSLVNAVATSPDHAVAPAVEALDDPGGERGSVAPRARRRRARPSKRSPPRSPKPKVANRCPRTRRRRSSARCWPSSTADTRAWSQGREQCRSPRRRLLPRPWSRAPGRARPFTRAVGRALRRRELDRMARVALDAHPGRPCRGRGPRLASLDRRRLVRSLRVPVRSRGDGIRPHERGGRRGARRVG